MTFLLDILLNEGQFSPYLNSIDSPLWLIISSDGISNSIHTPKIIPNPTVKFNFPARLILNLPSLTNSFLKYSLCTTSESDPTRIKLIASCQIRLDSFILGKCSKISFPLLDTLDTRREAAILSITASLSDLRNVQLRNTYQPTPLHEQSTVQTSDATHRNTYTKLPEKSFY